MQRLFLAFIFLGITVSPLAAQPKEASPPRFGTTRVAVVNVGVVFNKYEKAQAFKKDLEDRIAPYKIKGRILAEQMKVLQKDAQTPGIGAARKFQLNEAMRKHKDELAQMQAEITKVIGKKQEENLVALWQNMQEGVRTYAMQNGIDLVLGYGDVMDKELMDQFPNVNRKMQAMDQGGTLPLFFSPTVDISEGVVELLNRTAREEEKKTPVVIDPDLE